MEQERRLGPSIGMILVSAHSNQLGASLGALAFPFIGPIGVVTIRQYVAAIVLLVANRVRLRDLREAIPRSAWKAIIALGATFGIMNLTLYTAIDRLGLGLGVTLEFLGPLAVAIFTKRSRKGMWFAALAFVGVLLLTQPQPSSDFFGLAAGIISAVAWGCYILLNRYLGAQVPGGKASALAATVSSIFFLPILIFVFPTLTFTWAVLGLALASGVFSSAIPFIIDLFTLRVVPAQVFGLLMSIHPIVAAMMGWLILSQSLDLLQIAGILLVVAANTGNILFNRTSAV